MSNELVLYGAPTGSSVIFEIRDESGNLANSITATEVSPEIYKATISGIIAGKYDAVCKVNSVYNSKTEFIWDGSNTVEESTLTANRVWSAQLSSFVTPGTTGYNQNQISTAITVVQTILKYHKNRNKIDPLTYTLTIYEDDGVTPLRVFDLRDFNGNFSLEEIAERRPV